MCRGVPVEKLGYLAWLYAKMKIGIRKIIGKSVISFAVMFGIWIRNV